MTTTVGARFWAKVDVRGSNECWPFLGALDDNGYGNFRLNGKIEKAHRVAWWLVKGKWPTRSVLHKCDFPACQNTAHLFKGTQADNVRDCADKNRLNPGGRRGPGVPKRRVVQRRGGGGVGIFNGHAKLTEVKVLAIRARYAAGERQKDLAKVFGIHQSAVSNIVRGRNWAYLTPDNI